ncbi:Zn-ribbon domain-containing OB-fold protein [Microbacterium sp. A94]|uniref:Zn-ribbon domain-containing OB-fold protein n=1 Tax=Microbacterium sp. A94 TaxID=3450717 RepID=UPI003F42858D
MDQALPVPTPETQFYWDKVSERELWIQRCLTTGKHFFYPKLYSPFVLGGPTEWVRVSGKATLHSYNIMHRPSPGFEERLPYAIAVVELAEGPRMMTNIVGVENTPEALQLDMELEVAFEERDGVVLPVFRPAVIA